MQEASKREKNGIKPEFYLNGGERDRDRDIRVFTKSEDRKKCFIYSLHFFFD